MTKIIDRTDLPCKFARTLVDWVPYGSTNVSMETGDCAYDGDTDISEESGCDKTCPAYRPIDILICEKHDREYLDECPECEDEMYKKIEDAEHEADEYWRHKDEETERNAESRRA